MNDSRINLTLIRHGATKTNGEGRFCGITDIPLSPTGRQYISDMVSKHPYPVPQKIFCSPATRCRETAELSFPGVEYEIIDDLHEFDFGQIEQKLASDVWAIPEYADGWAQQSLDFSFPDGEKLGDCSARGISSLRRIISEAAENGWSEVAVVSHTVLFSLVLKALLADDLTDRSVLFIPNGMGLGVYVEPGESENDRPLHFSGKLPKGAPLPDMSNNPYIRKKS